MCTHAHALFIAQDVSIGQLQDVDLFSVIMQSLPLDVSFT